VRDISGSEPGSRLERAHSEVLLQNPAYPLSLVIFRDLVGILLSRIFWYVTKSDLRDSPFGQGNFVTIYVPMNLGSDNSTA
jgi:hypothetical protein